MIRYLRIGLTLILIIGMFFCVQPTAAEGGAPPPPPPPPPPGPGPGPGPGGGGAPGGPGPGGSTGGNAANNGMAPPIPETMMNGPTGLLIIDDVTMGFVPPGFTPPTPESTDDTDTPGMKNTFTNQWGKELTILEIPSSLLSGQLSGSITDAISLLENSDFSKAISSFDAILSENSDDVTALIGKAYALFETGEYSESGEILLDITKQDPGNADAWNMLFYTSLSTGEWGRALYAVEQSLELDPDNPDLLNQQGYVLDEMGRTDKAVQVLEEALELDPGNTDIMTNLAITNLHQQEYEDALTLFEDIEGSDPENELAGLYVEKIGKYLEENPEEEKPEMSITVKELPTQKEEEPVPSPEQTPSGGQVPPGEIPSTGGNPQVQQGPGSSGTQLVNNMGQTGGGQQGQTVQSEGLQIMNSLQTEFQTDVGAMGELVAGLQNEEGSSGPQTQVFTPEQAQEITATQDKGIQTLSVFMDQIETNREGIEEWFTQNAGSPPSSPSGFGHEAQDEALSELYGYHTEWQSLDNRIQELSAEVFDRREQIDTLMQQYGSTGGPLPTELVSLLNQQNADMNELNSVMGSMGELVQTMTDMNLEIAGPDNWPSYGDWSTGSGQQASLGPDNYPSYGGYSTGGGQQASLGPDNYPSYGGYSTGGGQQASLGPDNYPSYGGYSTDSGQQASLGPDNYPSYGGYSTGGGNELALAGPDNYPSYGDKGTGLQENMQVMNTLQSQFQGQVDAMDKLVKNLPNADSSSGQQREVYTPEQIQEIENTLDEGIQTMQEVVDQFGIEPMTDEEINQYVENFVNEATSGQQQGQQQPEYTPEQIQEMEDSLHEGMQIMQEVVNQFSITGSMTDEEIDQYVENFVNEATSGQQQGQQQPEYTPEQIQEMEDSLHEGMQIMQEVVNQFDITGSMTDEEIDEFVENFANEASEQSGSDHKAQDAALAALYGYQGVWQSLEGQIQELFTEVSDRRERIDALMTQYGLSGSTGGTLPTDVIALLNEQDADMNELSSLMGSMGNLVQSLYDSQQASLGPDNYPSYDDK